GITSTSVVDGGGDAQSGSYIDVAPGERYPWACWVWASAGNVSSRMRAHWYDANKSLISSVEVFSYTNTPIVQTLLSGYPEAPTNARYLRMQVGGGVPGVGGATGTVYFDGVRVGDFGYAPEIGSVRIFTSAGTWHKPAGLRAAR